MLRLSTERQPSVLGRSSYLAKVELKDSLGERELTRVVTRLRRMEDDDAAVGVVVVIQGLNNGWATLQELREALLRMKKRGKKVFAYLGAGSLRDYYVASAADKIWLDPGGGLRIQGVAMTVIFFKNLFDML